MRRNQADRQLRHSFGRILAARDECKQTNARCTGYMCSYTFFHDCLLSKAGRAVDILIVSCILRRQIGAASAPAHLSADHLKEYIPYGIANITRE